MMIKNTKKAKDENKALSQHSSFLVLIIISIQPEGRFLAGTRAQSGDRYGSGTLHSRQFFRGRLPLLSPAFRRSHFRP